MSSQPDTLKIWKAGVDLEQAILHFCDEATKERYFTLHQKRLNESQQQAEKASKDGSFIDNTLALLNLLAPTQGAGAEFKLYREKLQRLVIEDAEDCVIIGYGYALPRNPTDKPIEIPSDVWSGKVDWQKSILIGSSLSFESVRVIHEEDLAEILTPRPLNNTHAALQPTIKKAGRPSLKRFINEAFEELKMQGQINVSRPQKIYYDMIRSHLASKHPERAAQFRDMADETIRQTITDYFT